MGTLTPRLRRAAMLACAPLVLVLACGDSGTNPSTADISGTYTLQTIGGSPLPYTVQSGTTTVTLTSDVITVGSDGSWAEAEDFTLVSNGQTSTTSDSDGGTWTRSGTAVTFSSQTTGGTAYTGTYTNDTLTLDNGDGTPQVFHR